MMDGVRDGVNYILDDFYLSNLKQMKDDVKDDVKDVFDCEQMMDDVKDVSISKKQMMDVFCQIAFVVFVNFSISLMKVVSMFF